MFLAEFLFLGYPLVRKYVKDEGFFPRLLYSHVLSAALMISVLWGVYTVSRTIVPLELSTGLVVCGGVGGSGLFAYDLLRKRRLITRETSGILALIAFAVVVAIISAVTQPFSAQGDVYGYYVPLGRYLNQYPGAYIDSYYRFSLSRNFAYYAVYAHADLIGGSFGSYLFMPIPFLLGTIFGVISVSRRLTQQKVVPIIAVACYTFSVYFGLVLKFNTFYLGNLLMCTIALFYCYFLLAGPNGIVERLALPLSTFAMLLLYDFTLLLLIPLAFAYLAIRKPGLVFYVTASLSIVLLLVLSQVSVPLEFVQIPQLNIESSIALMGLLLAVIAGVRRGGFGPAGSSRIFVPVVLTYLAAAASLVLQRIANLLSYGFMTVDSYTLSAPVIAYMRRGYWFYQTPPDILNTLLSVFFSDVFFGWGLLFTVYGLFIQRGRPVTVFFLTLLPLTILVETINNNYFRFASFLAPLIVVFLASGLHKLARKNALLVGASLALVALSEKAATTLPSLDYEHRAITNPVDIAIFGSLFLLMSIVYLLRRFPGGLSKSSLAERLGSLLKRIPIPRSIGWPQIASILILVLCIPVISYNIWSNHYPTEITGTDASYADQQILPLIQDRSTVLTVELIHPNFNFYKDVVIVQMAQPWILESFLRLQLSNVSTLVSWLSTNGINYVFVDRGLTSGNQDVFGLFDQLSLSCSAYSLCMPRYNDGRFVLLQISAQ